MNIINVCIVIPHYNHGLAIDKLLLALEPYNLPCIVVDDGSDATTKQQLKNTTKQLPWVHLHELPYNQGKGAAVAAGLKYAAAKNHSHAIQIDADGQHNPNDIPKFLAAIKKHPSALILGQPIYDQSIPKSRAYGRAITNFWVYTETLSSNIKDSMCGYRAYPLKATTQIIDKYHTSKRMSFDIEIIVRLYWRGTKIVSIPTKVIYLADGISHFKLWQDNIAISWLHTKLFFGMLIRIPKLLKYKSAKTNKHWSQVKEKGSIVGIKIMLYNYKFLGRTLSHLLLYPIITYFYCTSSNAKKASRKYLLNLQNYLAKHNPKATPIQTNTFRHFLAFADSALDKLAVWNNDITLDHIDFVGIELFRNLIAQKQGGVIFTAHLGNIEIARALSKLDPTVKLNILLFHQNAKRINALFEQINAQFKFNIICIENLDIGLAIQLKGKVDAGEFIVIACDRTSVTQPQRCIRAQFLDHDAYFPQGPFLLAGLLQCPVYTILCFKQRKDYFRIIFEEFAQSMDIARKNRNTKLEYYAQKYAQLLEKYCQQYPLQWFNFFNFWQPLNSPRDQNEH